MCLLDYALLNEMNINAQIITLYLISLNDRIKIHLKKHTFQGVFTRMLKVMKVVNMVSDKHHLDYSQFSFNRYSYEG